MRAFFASFLNFKRSSALYRVLEQMLSHYSSRLAHHQPESAPSSCQSPSPVYLRTYLYTAIADADTLSETDFSPQASADGSEGDLFTRQLDCLLYAVAEERKGVWGNGDSCVDGLGMLWTMRACY